MFEEVIGHKQILSVLKRQLEGDTLSHAYLFEGPSGIGKRKIAEEFALSILKTGLVEKDREPQLEHADIKRIGYAAEKIGIREVRELIAETNVKPLEGIYRIFIIDHAEVITPVAQNAFLKTIEEPNPGNIFFFITEDPSALLPTIRSRCQVMSFHDLTDEEKLAVLRSQGISDTPEDLSATPGTLIERIKNPERYKRLKVLYRKLKNVISGDESEIFPLAEELGKDTKKEANEIVKYFIQKLNEEMREDEVYDNTQIQDIDYLIDLLERLQYNVNLRLQWEKTLIQISQEHV